MMDYASFAVLLSLERLCYGVVWKKPGAVSSVSSMVGMKKKEPEFLFSMVRMFKLVQMYVFGTWYYSHYGTALPSLGWTQLIIGLGLITFGQILNCMVWYRIGVDGVCYGCKFGRNVPWCTEFPFSHFAHPQYLGAILTVWGMFVFSSQDHSDWFILPLIESALYLTSMYVWEA